MDFLAWVAENGGPQVPVTAPTEDVGKLMQNLSGLSIDERYRLINASLPTISKRNLPDLSLTKDGHPSAAQSSTSLNAMYIAKQCGIRPRFNMQSRSAEFWLADDALQAIVPNEHAVKRTITDTCLRLGVQNTKQIETILVERSLDNRYHPMADWVSSVPWDGQSRLQQLVDTVDVVSGNELLWPMFLRKWLIQGIQAVFGWSTSRQIGHALVFSGKQGRRKSMWFESLVPKRFFTGGAKLSLNYNYKDSVMAVTKTPVTELGELDSTFKRSDIGAIKAFLSMHTDTYRAPYGELTLDIPRTTVFCATVNKVDFLVDETGDRRFWPVGVQMCRSDHQVDMQQMWAEAHTWWARGEQWWLSNEEALQQAEHSSYYRVTSAVEETFNTYVDRTAGQDSEHWVAMNLSTLMERLNIPTLPQHVGTVRMLMEEKFGQRHRRARGVQNAWIIPDPLRAGEVSDA